uniref:Defensin-like cystein-rich peptide n=1 Tax=Torenia fournieri TaxID=68875 RepID=B9ZZY3_9LAMI|nr:defensin-like cystein-rich peptide [Torenia fournieri]
MRMGFFSGLITLILLVILPLASASWIPFSKPKRGSYRLESDQERCAYLFPEDEAYAIESCNTRCKRTHGETAFGYCDFTFPYWTAGECQCWSK